MWSPHDSRGTTPPRVYKLIEIASHWCLSPANKSIRSLHPQPPPLLGSDPPRPPASCSSHPRPGYQTAQCPRAPEPLKLFELAHPTPASTALPIPSHGNHSKDSCSHFSLPPSASWWTLALPCGGQWEGMQLQGQTPVLKGPNRKKAKFSPCFTSLFSLRCCQSYQNAIFSAGWVKAHFRDPRANVNHSAGMARASWMLGPGWPGTHQQGCFPSLECSNKPILMLQQVADWVQCPDVPRVTTF